MDYFKFCAYKKEFQFLEHTHLLREFHQGIDLVSVRKLDENVLHRVFESPHPRDRYWDGAAGDSYDEVAAYVVYPKVKDEYMFRAANCHERRPIEVIASNKLVTVASLIVVETFGGFDVPFNKNEFDYGRMENWTIYKPSKSVDINKLIANEITKAKLEVQRAADF